MKKILVLSGLMMAAIVALTGCQKEKNFIDREFTVTASSTPDTKTKNLDMSTIWSDNDALSVFYATAGGTEYTSAGKFTISGGLGTTVGTFTAATEPELASGSYDWYALYPYGKGVITPASQNAAGGYTYVGSRNVLMQEGYNNMNVLCGSACPMYGVAKNVSSTEAPSFTMKQLATVIEFNVTNKTGFPIKVTKVTLDESESELPIVGSFYIDFTGEKPDYVASDAAYVSFTASTAVAGATELAEEGVAKVYMPLVPYAHDPMVYFKVIVEGDINGTAFTQTVSLKPNPQQCLFEAGKIRRVMVILDEVAASEESTVTEAIAVEDNTEVVVGNAIVAALTSRGYVITDGSNNVYVYTSSAPEVALGDKVRVSAKKTTYYDLPELTNPVATIISSGNEIPRTALTDITETIDSYSSTKADYLTVTGPMSKSGSTYVVTPEGATTNKASVSNPPAALNLASFEGKTVKMTGYYNTFHSGNKYVQIIVTEIEEVEGTEQPQPTTNTVAEALTGTIGSSFTIPQATIVSVVGVRLFVSDGTGTILVYNKNNSLTKGQKISFNGATKTYNNLPYFENPSITVLEGTDNVSLSPETWTDSQLINAYGSGNETIAFITCDVTMATASNGVIPDSNVVLYISKASGVSTSKDKRYTLTGFLYGWTDYTKDDVTTPEVCMFVERAVEVSSGQQDPILKLNGQNSLSLSFDATGAGRQIVTVTCDNDDWTVSGAPDWVLADTNTEPGKIIIAVEDNEGDERSVDLSVNHSDGITKATLTIRQAAASSGTAGAYTATLTNADIVAAGDAANGYQEWTVTDSASNTYQAYAIKNYHSKATKDNHYLQIKKYASETAYYIKLPTLGTKIVSITMTVSNANKPMSDGGNSATLFFSASNSTSAEGEGVAKGIGASSVTIDASSLNLNTGYITASAGVRIWDIVISYD